MPSEATHHVCYASSMEFGDSAGTSPTAHLPNGFAFILKGDLLSCHCRGMFPPFSLP